MFVKRFFVNIVIDILFNLDMLEFEFWKKKSIDLFLFKYKVFKRCLCFECYNVLGILEFWDVDLKVFILNYWRFIFFDEYGSKM